MGEPRLRDRSGLAFVACLLALGQVACESDTAAEALAPDAVLSDGAHRAAATTPCETSLDCASVAPSGGCEVATCDVSTFTCERLPAPNGTPCAASETTCGVEGTCEAGLCLATPSAGAACDDGNPCTVDVCAPGTGCAHFSIPDGSSCDDERTCTTSDSCQAGLCQGTEVGEDCTEPQCGDGTCDSGEDEEGCPADCPAERPEESREESPGLCGDGACTDDESPETCAQDCPMTESECGDGICEGAESFFCPQDCQ